MKEQQSTQFYDKLLSYLNKSYVNNFRTQELYLDLSRNTRKLRFRSIKNIYNTLTEGKADEIIYNKDKGNISKSQIYDQTYRYTKQLCWRLVEKLITKIAYYLTYEKGLKELAPTILKAIGFIRKATDKINNKASFIQFFEEAVDILIEENNILAKKIYKLLIDRGYIYSVEEFYKLSRFESHKDFVYNFDSDREDQQTKDPVIEGPRVRFKDKIGPTTTKMLKGSRKGIFSSKRVPLRSSIMKDHNFDDEIAKVKTEIENISEDQAPSESFSSTEEEDLDRTNKINHAIHSQVAKAMEQLTTHPNFQIFLGSLEQEHHKPEISGHEKKPRMEHPIKQIIKNIRLKNFKANETILQINEKSLDGRNGRESERKNSRQKMEENRKKLSKRKIQLRNRTSIATAISSRMKQNIFKLEGVDNIQNLVIRNLRQNMKYQYNQSEFDKKTSISGKDPKGNTFTRSIKRQQTYAAESTTRNLLATGLSIKKDNLDFLSNAFVFHKGNNRSPFYRKKQGEADIYLEDSQQQDELVTLNTLLSQKLTQSKQKIHFQSCRQNHESSVFRNQRLHQAYGRKQKEVDLVEKKPKKKAKKKQNKFNTAILHNAAKKYHRYSSEGGQHFNIDGQTFNIHQILTEGIEQVKQTKYIASPHKPPKQYFHNKIFQVYDRRKRKFV